jgi:uncharacterized protein (TIGR02265 family)
MGTLIKGTTLLARFHFLDEAGRGMKQRVLDTLAPADRDQLSRLVLPVREYPLELNARLDEAIARVLFPGEPVRQVFRRLGRASADRNTTRFHGSFSSGDAEEVLARVTKIRRQFFNDGDVRYVRIAPGEGRIEIWNAATVTTADCESSAGYMERMIELAGAKDVSMTHDKCVLDGAPCCEFPCRWSVR